MAATLSYAKIVRNQKDDETSTQANANSPEAPINAESATENKPESIDKGDPSYKEVSNGKKVCQWLFKIDIGSDPLNGPWTPSK